MSAEDFANYGGLLPKFVGHPLALSLPTNSIKLMVDRERHSDDYIWIDPPWTLLRDGVVAGSSASYPSPEADDYLIRHEAWGAVVRDVLEGGVLEGASGLSDGTTEFTFEGGISLRVEATDRDEEGYWYDDWYARARGAAERALEADGASRRRPD